MGLLAQKDIIEALFGKGSHVVQSVISGVMNDSPTEFRQYDKGHVFKFVIHKGSIYPNQIIYEAGGTTRCSFYYTSGDNQEVPDFRLDVPTIFLIEKKRPKFWLYNIRFCIYADDKIENSDAMMPLKIGYYGITKRGIFQRFREHLAKMASGRGHVLHKAWRSLHSTGIKHYPVIQVSGIANSLDEIYQMEEDAVEQMSLAPRGLNAISGGYAGIKMLHKLALLSGKKVIGIDERDAALSQLEKSSRKGEKCTHYRSGHLRKLPNGKVTWVNPCWIKLANEIV